MGEQRAWFEGFGLGFWLESEFQLTQGAAIWRLLPVPGERCMQRTDGMQEAGPSSVGCVGKTRFKSLEMIRNLHCKKLSHLPQRDNCARHI